MVEMPSAQEARDAVENVELLNDDDIQEAKDKTLDAISKGRNLTGMSFDKKCDARYTKMYPLRRLLASLGYNTTFTNYTNTTVLNWSW